MGGKDGSVRGDGSGDRVVLETGMEEAGRGVG